MHKLNCLIIDDEELARNLIEQYLLRLPHVQLVAKCANPLEAIAVLQDQAVDLLFLDIQMPELTGIEFLKSLSHKPAVIFTTAHRQYALDGYDLDVVDFLLKPFRFERFVQAVNKASKSVQKVTPVMPTPEVAEGDHKTLPDDVLLVHANHRIYRIPIADLLYIESMREYVAYHTADTRIVAIGTLRTIAEQLPAGQFLRIHKSYIVAKDKVKALEGNRVLINDTKIPVGGSYKQVMMRELF